MIDAQTIGNILGGVIIGGYSAMRLLAFFRQKKNDNNPGKCPDSTCHDLVITTAQKTHVHEKQIAELFKISQHTSADLNFIRGKLSNAKIIRFDEG